MDKLKEKLSSLGLLVFTISFFWIAIVSIDKQLTNWDQFSYWSYAARNMYISNQFIINPGIGMQYPPAPTIIQYFFATILPIPKFLPREPRYAALRRCLPLPTTGIIFPKRITSRSRISLQRRLLTTSRTRRVLICCPMLRRFPLLRRGRSQDISAFPRAVFTVI